MVVKQGRVIAYTPPKTRAFERIVKAKAIAMFTLLPMSVRKAWPMQGRFRVEVTAYFPDARRRDGENVGKCIGDACNGVLWDDDSQITTMVSHRKIDRENPRTEILVEALYGPN